MKRFIQGCHKMAKYEIIKIIHGKMVQIVMHYLG